MGHFHNLEHSQNSDLSPGRLNLRMNGKTILNHYNKEKNIY